MNRVPKIRFKEFSGEWEEDILLNLTKLIKDGTHGTHINVEKGIPLLSAKDIKKGKILIPNDCRKISLDDFNTIHRNYKLSKGDLLITLVGTIGETAIIDEYYDNYTFQRSVGIIKVDEKNSNVYMLKYFNSSYFIKQLNYKASSSAQAGVYLGELGKCTIKYPSLPEQEKIADFLSSVDIKIEKLERKKELWEEYKKGMMQKIFSQEIRFKDENGNEYPQWDEKRLGEITEEKSIRNKFLENNFVLSVNNKKGFIPQSEQFLKREVASQDKSNYKIILKGEFAYNPSRINVGSIAYLDSYASGILSPMYVIFSIKDDINPHYLLEFITTNDFFQQMKLLLAGSVRESLVYKAFCEIKLEIPCFLEQEKIAHFLSSIDSKIEITEKELEGMKELKKGLLQGMFV